MNTEFTSDFAKQLAADPSLFGANREAMLVELITSFVDGTLPAADAREVAALLEANPRAKTIHDNIVAANCFLASDDGQAWLSKPLTAQSKTPRKAHSDSPAFFTRLSDWLTDLFGAGLLAESYAADASDDQIVKSFPAASGEPFEAELVKDGVGRWFLRVFTKDASAAAHVLAVDMEREAPVLRFAPVSETLFEAEVRISETMAQALSAGHRPVFRSAE